MNTKVRLLTRGAVGAAALIVGLCVAPGEAAAQYVQNSPPIENNLLTAGMWEGGINLAGMLAFNSASTDAASNSQRTIYLNPGGFAGYMIADTFQIRVVASYLHIFSDTSTGVLSQNADAFLGAVQGLYHYPLPMGLAFYLGAGAAGYGGSSTRGVTLTVGGSSSSLRVVQSTYGFGGQALLGLLAQPAAHMNVRGGLRFDALFGKETPDTSTTPASAGLSAQSTQNYQLMIEIAASFR